MDSRFEQQFSDRFTNPDFETFKIVFYPDRIYHAAYLNATRSPRYRYNVHEDRIIGWMRLLPVGFAPQEGQVKLIYDKWVDAYQVEIWETLEPPLGKKHD